MPVTFLELENFKSYAGRHVIGPFRDFTSVIGPNGSGKSNLMDAISFVLGVQSRDLRSHQMKDLIFRPPGKRNNHNNNHNNHNNHNNNSSKRGRLAASATLIYEREQDDDDDDQDDDDDDNSNHSHDNSQSRRREIRYTRSISTTGVGEYRVNGQVCTLAEYESKLSDIGVLVKARNFLVFQGDVESLARKTPVEMVQLMEQLSGSWLFKNDYDKALQEKELAEEEKLFCMKKQKAIRTERRLLKEQKEEAQRFQDLWAQRAQLSTNLYLWMLYQMDQDRLERQEKLDELQEELQALTETETQAAQALKDAKKQASAARRVSAQAEQKRVTVAAKLDQLEPSLIQTTEEINNLQKKWTQDEKELVKKRNQVDSHQGKLQQLDQEIADYRDTLAQVEADYEEIKKQAGPDVVHLTPEQEVEYQRVREAAAAAGAEPRRVLASHNRQLEAARSQAAKVQDELNQAQASLATIVKDVEEFTEREEKLTKVCVRNLVLFFFCGCSSSGCCRCQHRLTAS